MIFSKKIKWTFRRSPDIEMKSPEPERESSHDDNDEWEIRTILDSRWTRIAGKRVLQYQVEWVGWPEDKEWYDADGGNFDNGPEVVRDFHSRYPAKPRMKISR